jgi:hypothetical protein
MISAAKSIIVADNAEFHCAGEFSRQVDYGMASGVFNVKLENSDDDWLKYILHVLDGINEKSALGFAVNFLSTYSDSDKRKSKLFYANPLRMFDCFRRRYSRNLSLMHDYGLYEFSIVVRKNK